MLETSSVLVSVLVTNYNYGRFIEQSIRSVLSQTYRNLQIIVVDDGSTDHSREIIASFGDAITPILKENGGQTSALNAAYPTIRGEIICLLDADDYFAPDKVERIVAVMTADPSLGWCFDEVRPFDNRSGVARPFVVKQADSRWDVRDLTMEGKPPYVDTSTSGLSFRRRVYAEIFPMPPQLCLASGCSSDAYMKWAALALEPGWYTAQELTHMRLHDANAYTGRLEGKDRLRGEIELATGMCLYERWPTLRRFCVKIVSRGLGMLWARGGLSTWYSMRLGEFLQKLTFRQRSELLLRATVWGGFRMLMR